VKSPLFFFSYARNTYKAAEGSRFTAAERETINSIDEFYKKLCREVAAGIQDRNENEVGFFDQQDLDLSAPWPDRLVEALLSSSVLVALFSPVYFSRRACGREFEVFRRRYSQLTKNNKAICDHRIIPILWERPDYIHKSIPSCCRADIDKLQLTPPGAPHSYAGSGLRRLFEQEKRAEWNGMCDLIASRILQLSDDQISLPTLDPVDFNSLPSAFHTEAEADRLARPIDRSKREIRVYYLVPTRSEWKKH
jgi:hypothetical protein